MDVEQEFQESVRAEGLLIERKWLEAAVEREKVATKERRDVLNELRFRDSGKMRGNEAGKFWVQTNQGRWLEEKDMDKAQAQLLFLQQRNFARLNELVDRLNAVNQELEVMLNKKT